MNARFLLSLVACCLLAVACSNSPRRSSSNPSRNQPEQQTRQSPLGVGYPDPLGIVRKIRIAMEEENWAGACDQLASLGRNGRPVPLVAGKNVPDVPPEAINNMKPFFEHLRGLERPWVQVRYGTVTNLRNDPPMVAVPFQSTYDYPAIREDERRLILHSWSKEIGRTATWPEFVQTMQERDRTRGDTPDAIWTFVYLGEAWRLYLGPAPKKS